MSCNCNQRKQVLIEDIAACRTEIIYVKLNAGNKAEHDTATMQNLSLVLLNVLSELKKKKNILGNI